MKRILIILTVCLFLLTSCATFPPPQIQDGRYTNPKYGFSIEVPKGWHQTKKIPDWFKGAFSEQEKSQISIMFFNNDTNGCIIIINDKPTHSIPPSALDETISFDNVVPGSLTDHYIYQPIKQKFEKRKKQLIKNSHIKNYSYKIYSIKKYTEEYSYETEFNKMEVRSGCFLYRCQKDCVYVFGIVLVSDIKTFDENYAMFNKVIDSFRKFEYIFEDKTKDVSEASIKNLLPIDWVSAVLGWWAAGGM